MKSSWNPLRPIFKEVGELVMHANAIKFFESEHRIPSHTHLVELGTGQPIGPPWSVAIETEILIHDPTIRGNLGRLCVLTLPQSSESLITPGRANFVFAW